MNRTDSPDKQPVPFGVNGQREPILSTTPAGDNTASYNSGFPPITMTLKSAGGLPPKGQDMNQILFELSALARWGSTGAINRFDTAFSTAIGGYPQDALVLGDDGITVWRSSTNNNANNPNSVTTGWVKVANDISSILQLGTAANRNVGTGPANNLVPDMGSFIRSLASSGYQNIPGGMLLQWGTAAISGSGTTSSVTYPIPFPTSTFLILMCDTGGATTTYGTTNRTTSGFTAVRNISSGNTVGFYFALGN